MTLNLESLGCFHNTINVGYTIYLPDITVCDQISHAGLFCR